MPTRFREGPSRRILQTEMHQDCAIKIHKSVPSNADYQQEKNHDKKIGKLMK